jgi:putative methanogenesis marker protein 17
MNALETFIVESAVPQEAEAYRSIVADVISELVLGGAIGRIRVVLRPEDSLFQMAIVLRGSQPPVRLADVADLGYGVMERKEVRISIREEKYLSPLLEKLWARYGRGQVLQPERNTLIVRQDQDPEKEIKYLEDMIIADPKQGLQSRLIEMAIRSTPEGFRVRYHSMKENSFIFVASEDMLKPEWIQQAHQMLAELQEEQ